MAHPGGAADLVAAVLHGGRAALVGTDVHVVGPVEQVAEQMASLAAGAAPRWVWWSARYAGPLVSAAGATGVGCWPMVGVVIEPGSRVTLVGAPVAVGAVGVETGATSSSKKFFTVSMNDFTCLRMLISFMIAW